MQNEFAAHVLELLEPVGPVSARRMFSGVGFHHGGAMFGMIIRDELYFKVGERNRPDFEAAGQQPFSYATKNGRNTIHSLWSCPPELLDDPEEFAAWARKAIDAALAAVKAKPKRKTRPKLNVKPKARRRAR
jgi:DNA transformation protein